MESKNLRQGFLIEEWLIQPQLNRIAVNGEVIQVEPKIMDVLVCLAEHPGSVITREHLFQTVWTDTHVTGHVLSRSISELRKIFNDDPKHPRVIETIPRTGYRLIGSISQKSEESADSESGMASQTLTPHPPLFWKSALHRLGAAIVLTAVVMTLLMFYLILFVKHIGPFHFRHP